MRYLNVIQGRFIQRDPIGIWTDGLNLGNAYTYVGNNPVNYFDPRGLKTPKNDCSGTRHHNDPESWYGTPTDLGELNRLADALSLGCDDPPPPPSCNPCTSCCEDPDCIESPCPLLPCDGLPSLTPPRCTMEIIVNPGGVPTSCSPPGLRYTPFIPVPPPLRQRLIGRLGSALQAPPAARTPFIPVPPPI